MASPINAKAALSTAGASSPISVPVSLSSGPAISSGAPVNTVNFGALQVGGKGNNAAAGLPTPTSFFGGSVEAIAQSPVMLIGVAAIAAYFLMRK